MMNGKDRYEDDDFGNLQELVNKFNQVLDNQASHFFDADELEIVVDYFIDTNKHKSAFAAIDFALSQYPYSVSFHLRKAQLLAAKNQAHRALEVLSQAQSMDPMNSEMYMTKGAIYSQMGLTEQAIENFYQALAYAESDKDEVYLYLAFEFENTNKHEKAISCLKKALAYNPNNDRALYEMAFCYDVTGNWEESIAFLNDFIDDHPFSDAAWFNLGVSYNKCNQPEKAIDAYDYCLAINPYFDSASFNKANAYAMLEDYNKAIEIYKETIELEMLPNPTTYYYIGECYEKMEQNDKALSYYNKAVKIDPKFADGWIGIGVIMENQNRLTEALHHVKKALSLEDNNADYWYIFGDIQQKLGFYDEAEEAFQRVVALAPENTDIWLDYSNLLFEQEDKNGALEVLADGIKHHPGCSEIQYRMAACLMMAGQTQEGLAFLQRALQLNYPKHTEMFDYVPELKNNPSVLELIESYKNEL